MKCFFHSADLDGHCSGAILKLKYPDCELYPINYGDDFPWSEIRDGEPVYMVDFALQPFSDMVKLNAMCKLYWIDHHKSAIESYEESGIGIAGVREVGKAGCELTWNYVFDDRDMPDPVMYLGRYDIWDHSDEYTLPFQYGMRMFETRPDIDMLIWEEILGAWDDSDYHPVDSQFAINDIIEKGRTIIDYIGQDNDKYCSSCSFEIEFNGLRCIAINKMLTNSKVFDGYYDPEKHDAMMTFGYRKGKWTVSLYTDKESVDVSEIAKSLGGGGHKQAAGFQCEFPPFLPISG